MDWCKKLLVVDVDPGIDDAFAVLVLIAAHKLNLICLAAIVCSVGNVKREQSCQNLAYLVDILNYGNEIFPITFFEGSSSPMIKPIEFSEYYGKDGLGDVANRSLVQTDHFRKYHEFQEFMHDLTEKYPMKVSFMTLGPQTVAATLLLQQPEIKLRDIWIMGGNDIEMDDFTEWNFYVDPHAANITLNHSNVPIYLATFQACENLYVPMTWRIDTLGSIHSAFIEFMNKAEWNFYGGKVPKTWVLYDPVIAVAFVNNATITKKEIRGVQVYLGEKNDQGLLIPGEKNVTFLNGFNAEIYKRTIEGAAKLFV